MGWDDVVKTEQCDGKCGWERVLETLDGMCENVRYGYAWDTLNSIYDWINQHKHVTERQKEAVRNIYDKPSSNRDDSGWSDYEEE